MPVASVERFRGTLETVKRELEQTDPQTNITIFCPTDEEMGRLSEALGHLGKRLTLVKGRLSGGFHAVLFIREHIHVFLVLQNSLNGFCRCNFIGDACLFLYDCKQTRDSFVEKN